MPHPRKLLVLFGTRPEAIKLCTLVHQLRARNKDFSVRVCVTGQHRGMLDSVLNRFELEADYDLDVMRPNQGLAGLTSRILDGLDQILERDPPEFIVVQGDTTSTLAGALAGFYRSICVAHVEAGLRTGDPRHPFPEEMNRILTTRLSGIHFAPTRSAYQNLLNEGLTEDTVFITGNTGIDALLYTQNRLENGTWSGFDGNIPTRGKKLILVTTHRRENFGLGLEDICLALLRLAERDDIEIALPVHKNPNVSKLIERRLSGQRSIHLIEPQDYVSFIDLMRRATLILTDSGGVQEEAPSLGKPVLVMREKTERQEAVAAGAAILVGTNKDRIVSAVNEMLKQLDEHSWLPIANPFGDGRACERIANILAQPSKVR